MALVSHAEKNNIFFYTLGQHSHLLIISYFSTKGYRSGHIAWQVPCTNQWQDRQDRHYTYSLAEELNPTVPSFAHTNKKKLHSVKSTRCDSNEHFILSMNFNNITLFGNQEVAYFNKAKY